MKTKIFTQPTSSERGKPEGFMALIQPHLQGNKLILEIFGELVSRWVLLFVWNDFDMFTGGSTGTLLKVKHDIYAPVL